MEGPIKLVTGNPNKLRELRQILGFSEEQMTHADVQAPEIQGTSEEVVKAKVVDAGREVGYPCMVMDTSLGTNALGGKPGPYIKDFLKSPGPEGIYKMLIGFGDFSGYALCLVAVQLAADQEPIIFEGRVDGTIVEPQGKRGFDWDPIFKPDGYDLTFAQMDAETKNGISHRGRALVKFQEWYQNVTTTEVAE